MECGGRAGSWSMDCLVGYIRDVVGALTKTEKQHWTLRGNYNLGLGDPNNPIDILPRRNVWAPGV